MRSVRSFSKYSSRSSTYITFRQCAFTSAQFCTVFPGVLFFLEEAAERLSPVLPGLAAIPVCWKIERERRKGQPGRGPQPSRRWQPTGAQPQDDEAGSAAACCWPRRKPRRHRQKRPANTHGEPGPAPPPTAAFGRRTATTERTAAPANRRNASARRAGRPRTGNTGNGSPRDSRNVKVVFEA